MKSRIGKLLGHRFTDRKQRLFQSDQKQGQAEQYMDHADQHAFQAGNRLPQNHQLKKDDDADDRQHIAQGSQQSTARIRSIKSMPGSTQRKDDNAVAHDENHRKQGGEGDQTETVDQWITPSDDGRQADAKSGHQRHGDG